MARNLLTSSLQHASFNIVFQILFRCVTFIINAWVIRNVGHAVLGIMNVRLLLLESTILFLSREPFYRACLGQKDSNTWPHVINQIWLSVPLSIILSTVFMYIWLHVLPLGHPEYETQYVIGCWSVCISCIIELCSANVVLVAQVFCFFKLKVALETLHIVTRSVVFLCIVVTDTNMALIAFSVAQLVSIGAISASYYLFFYWYIQNKQYYKEGKLPNKYLSKSILKSLYDTMDDFPFTSMKQLMPTWLGSIQECFSGQLCVLTMSFAKQGVVKQILTEGEKYVMSISPVMTFSEQATYDVVNNLGSLTARFIFRPIEESSYFYFTQMIKRDVPIVEQDQHMIAESCTVLSQVCKTVASIGLIGLVFGQSYAQTLLVLYGGETFVQSGLPVQLLRSHCFAIVLLAVNGVTECYSFATMTSSQLNHYNYLMVFFSISFLILSYVLTYTFGPVGFIISNCINMLARITHSIHFINLKYEGSRYNPLSGLYVGKLFFLILIVAGLICKYSEITIGTRSQTLHILVGVVCFLFVMMAWAYENKNLLKIFYEKYISKEKNKESLD